MDRVEAANDFAWQLRIPNQPTSTVTRGYDFENAWISDQFDGELMLETLWEARQKLRSGGRDGRRQLHY
ncbi:hypothetical protein PM082_015174 [Marasmius tenuissimus]|nr:hypothetical protein PM082_015174 [Marasmius tenuissimus]